MQDRVRGFLEDHGAAEIDHPGGTLLAHLERVSFRLSDLGASQVAVAAGSAHAVYGTDGFDTWLVSIGGRQLVRHLLDDETEEAIYRYAACDRTKTWQALSQDRILWDRWSRKSEVLDGLQLADFVDISIVNEVDVLEQSAELRAECGAAMLAIVQSWEGLGTHAVWHDALSSLAS